MTTELSFRPLEDYLVVGPCEEGRPGTLCYGLPQKIAVRGKVLALGAACINGMGSPPHPWGVVKGDLILFSDRAGIEVLGEDPRGLLILLREADILAIIESDENAEG